MKRFLPLVLAATAIAGIPVVAQFAVPDIAFDSAADPLKFPDNIHLGEAAGVATNSKGDVIVYTRTGHPTLSLGGARAFAHGGSRLFRSIFGNSFVRSAGLVRIRIARRCGSIRRTTSGRPDVEHGDRPINAQVALLGRKSESENVPARGAAPPPLRGVAGRPGALAGAWAAQGAERRGAVVRDPRPGWRRRCRRPSGPADSRMFNRPSDVAWDAGNFVPTAWATTPGWRN